MGSYAQALENKQALKDSELQGKINDLIGQRTALVTKISSLDKGTPEYDQAFDTLRQVETGLRDTYHPEKNPGAIERFGHLLTDHLGITNPKQRIQKEAAKRTQGLAGDENAARLEAASAPLSPEQIATLKESAIVKSQIAAIDASPLSDSDKEEARRAVFKLAAKPNLKLYVSPDGGTKAWLDANRPDNIPVGWTAYAATSAQASKEAQFAAFKQKYKEEHNGQDYPGTMISWAAQQGAIGRAGGNPLKFNPATGQIQDLTTGTLYNENDPTNPSQVASMFKASNDFQAKKQAFQIKLAKIRSASYGEARQMAPLQVFDTANGNAPTYATFLEMKKQPGRYIPAGPAAKALTQENLMEDLTGVSGILRTDITDMKEDFPEAMKAKIAFATQAEDPAGALNALVASGALGSLPDDQFKVYVDLQQLAENAMAMRSVLGAGQGSDQVRSAIRATLPSLLSPNKKDALVQLDAYDKTIARLRRGIPKVQLRTDIGNGTETGVRYIYAKDPKGKVHKAKFGTPLPKGWTLTNAPEAK